MELLERLLSSDLAYHLGWMLLHSLWLMLVPAGLLGLLLLALPGRKSKTRYAVSCVAMLLLAGSLGVAALLVPQRVVTIDEAEAALAEDAEPAPAPPAETPAPPPVALEGADAVTPGLTDWMGMGGDPASVADPIPGSAALADTDTPADTPDQAVSAEVETSHEPASGGGWYARSVAAVEPYIAWAVPLWLFGVVALALWHLGGLIATHRLRSIGTRPAPRHAARLMEALIEQMGIRRAVTLLESAVVQSPVVIGFIKPVVLVPASVFTGLTPAQLEAILAHELAHIRRHDFAVNLFQTLLVTLLFYHPAVWWVSRVIRNERECCCDDIVVNLKPVDGGFAASGGERKLDYAKALTRVALLSRRNKPGKLAVAADHGSLLERIKRMMGMDDPAIISWAGGPGPKAWLAGVLVLLIAVALPITLLAGDNGVPVSPDDGDSAEVDDSESVEAGPSDEADANEDARPWLGRWWLVQEGDQQVPEGSYLIEFTEDGVMLGREDERIEFENDYRIEIAEDQETARRQHQLPIERREETIGTLYTTDPDGTVRESVIRLFVDELRIKDSGEDEWGILRRVDHHEAEEQDTADPTEALLGVWYGQFVDSHYLPTDRWGVWEFRDDGTCVYTLGRYGPDGTIDLPIDPDAGESMVVDYDIDADGRLRLYVPGEDTKVCLFEVRGGTAYISIDHPNDFVFSREEKPERYRREREAAYVERAVIRLEGVLARMNQQWVRWSVRPNDQQPAGLAELLEQVRPDGPRGMSPGDVLTPLRPAVEVPEAYTEWSMVERNAWLAEHAGWAYLPVPMPGPITDTLPVGHVLFFERPTPGRAELLACRVDDQGRIGFSHDPIPIDQLDTLLRAQTGQGLDAWAFEDAGDAEQDNGLDAASRRVVIPDMDEPRLPDGSLDLTGRVLDLRTGELLDLPPRQDERTVARQFGALGQGDLMYEHASGRTFLITLRGATLTYGQEGEHLDNEGDGNGLAGYELLPSDEWLTITTAEGDAYTLRIVERRGGEGIEVLYAPGTDVPELPADLAAEPQGESPLAGRWVWCDDRIDNIAGIIEFDPETKSMAFFDTAGGAKAFVIEPIEVDGRESLRLTDAGGEPAGTLAIEFVGDDRIVLRGDEGRELLYREDAYERIKAETLRLRGLQGVGDEDAAAGITPLVGRWVVAAEQVPDVGVVWMAFEPDGAGRFENDSGHQEAFTWRHDPEAGTLMTGGRGEEPDLFAQIEIEGNTMTLRREGRVMTLTRDQSLPAGPQGADEGLQGTWYVQWAEGELADEIEEYRWEFTAGGELRMFLSNELVEDDLRYSVDSERGVIDLIEDGQPAGTMRYAIQDGALMVTYGEAGEDGRMILTRGPEGRGHGAPVGNGDIDDELLGMWYIQKLGGEWVPTDETDSFDITDDGLIQARGRSEAEIRYRIDTDRQRLVLLDQRGEPDAFLGYTVEQGVLVLTNQRADGSIGVDPRAIESIQIVLTRSQAGNAEHRRMRAQPPDPMGTRAKMRSAQQMRSMYQGLATAARSNRETYPDSVGVLLTGDFVTPEFLLAPWSGIEVPGDYREWNDERKAAWAEANCSYAFILPGERVTLDTEKVILFELPLVADMERIGVCYEDNHTNSLPYDEADALILEQTGRDLMGWMEHMGREQRPAPDEADEAVGADQAPAGPGDAARGDAIEGNDFELLLRVAEAHRDNTRRIETWTGRADVTDQHTDPEGDGYSMTSVAEFVTDQNQGKRWRWEVTEAQRTEGGVRAEDPRQISVADEMIHGGAFYKLSDGIRRAGSDDWERTMVVLPAEEAGRHISMKSRSLDPHWYLTNDGSAIPDWLVFFYEHRDEIGGRLAVTRKEAVVTVELTQRGTLRRLRFDLEQGGNLIERHVTQGESTWNTEITYREIEGVWIPARYVHTWRTPDRGEHRREVVFRDQVLNQPVPEAEFTMEAMGILPDMRVSDHLRGLAYEYPNDENARRIHYERPVQGGHEGGGITLHELAAFWDGGTLGFRYTDAEGQQVEGAIDGRRFSETKNRLCLGAMHPTHDGAEWVEEGSERERAVFAALRGWVEHHYSTEELAAISANPNLGDLPERDVWALQIVQKLEAVERYRQHQRAAAKLAIYPASFDRPDPPRLGGAAETMEVPDGLDGETRRVYRLGEALLTADDVAGVRYRPAGDIGSTITLTFTPDAAERLLAYTRDHLNEPLLICIDGRPVTAPTIRQPLSEHVSITGSTITEEMGRAIDQAIDQRDAEQEGGAEAGPEPDTQEQSGQAAPADPGIRLAGLVLDKPGGRPAPGVTVALVGVSDQPPRQAVTGADGRYVFENVPSIGMAHLVQVGEHGPGVWTEDARVFVRAPNQRDGVEEVRTSDLYTDTSCTITGRVTDAETGEGVAGARVRVSTTDRNRASVRTDEQGRYRLHTVARDVVIECDENRPRYYAPTPTETRPANTPRRELTGLAEGQAVGGVDFAVYEAPSYSMRFEMPDGSPARGLEVYVLKMYTPIEPLVGEGVVIGGMRILGNEDRLRTDADGRVTGHLLSVHGREQPAEIEITVITRTDDQRYAVSLKMKTTTDAAPPEDLLLTLQPCGSAEFKIVGPEQEIIEQPRLSAQADYLGWHTFMPDSVPAIRPTFTPLGDGRYRATGLIPGWRYGFGASAEGYRTRRELRVDIEPGDHLDAGDLQLVWRGPKAVPGLIELLQHVDSHERSWACRDLAAFGGEAVEAVPALIELLNTDPENAVRQSAAKALGDIGPAAESAVPHLIRAAEYGTDRVPRRAVVALGQIGGAEALPELNRLREQTDDVNMRRILNGAIQAIEAGIREEAELPDGDAQGNANDAPDPWQIEVDRLGGLLLEEAGRSPVIRGYEALIEAHPDDPRIGEAMLAIANLYGSIAIPELGIEPDRVEAKQWVQRAADESPEGSHAWIEARFILAQWLPMEDAEVSRRWLEDIRGQARGDSLTLLRVEHGLMGVRIQEHQWEQAVGHAEAILAWYGDPANIPEDPFEKTEADVLIGHTGDYIGYRLGQPDVPVETRARLMRRLRDSYPLSIGGEVPRDPHQPITLSRREGERSGEAGANGEDEAVVDHRRAVIGQAAHCHDWALRVKTSALTLACEAAPDDLRRTLEGLVRLSYHELNPALVRAMLDQDDLPMLHAMLADPDQARQWPEIAQVICFLSDDPAASVPVVLDYIRRPTLGRRAESDHFGYAGRAQAIEWLGFLGGDEAEQALIEILTEEGAAELTARWDDGPGPGWFESESGGKVNVVMGRAALGLVSMQSEDGTRAVEERFAQACIERREMTFTPPHFQAYIRALTQRDVIALVGLDIYHTTIFEQDRGDAAAEQLHKPYWDRMHGR
ncbi:MAG: M56 family metallopeptidase [Phycisphaerales bacterium JB063]